MRLQTTLLIGTVLCTLSARATDRVVSASGTFNTISSAIAVSSDGDRILVESGTYDETFAIRKSISLLPRVEGGRYRVNGPIQVESGTQPMSVLISGIRAYNMITPSGTSRLDLRIVDSYLSNPNMAAPLTHLELYRDTLANGISLQSGSLIGNFISPYGGQAHCVFLDPGTLLPDQFLFIGNALSSYQYGNSNYASVFLNVSTEFHIENNFVTNQLSILRFLSVAGTVPVGTAFSTICNNTFYRIGSANLMTITGTTTGIVNVNIQNNVTIGDTGGQVNWPNMFGKVSNNSFAAPSWINTTTGASLAGTPLLNAGDPDPRYLDLDLTVNDVGCYGGSNSRANFTTGMGSAVVGFMQAPRVVAQGEAVNISAVGFDR